MNTKLKTPIAIVVMGIAFLVPHRLFARQQPEAPASKPLAVPAAASASQPATKNAAGASMVLTLTDALNLAKKNSPQLQAAVTEAGITHEDKNIARAGLLPNVNFNTAAIYTQSNSLGNVKYIANNAPHEYISQGNVHQQLDLATLAAYRSTAALAAAAKARKEIATRGLTVTVVQSYFAVAAAEQKLGVARQTSEEGEKFLELTESLEKGGEVAHADVIKAELQMQERRRQLQEAQLALLNARLDLAVLIFPDFNDNYQTADDLHASVPLPPRDAFEAQAGQGNPEIRAALETARASEHDVKAAWAGYLPNIGLDYFYGIDAPNYATNSVTPDGKIQQFGISGGGLAESAGLELGRNAKQGAPGGIEAGSGQEGTLFRPAKIAGGDALSVFRSGDSSE